MNSRNETNLNKLDFISFLRQFFSHIKIESSNKDILIYINLWANRDEKFNGIQRGWHIDKGLLFYGNVGSGKTEMFDLLQSYLKYLRSPYVYEQRVVWEYAKEFMKKDVGYSCFDGEQIGNKYYDELALTDQGTLNPTREYAMHYGTKILIGAELIQIRNKVFNNTGYQTHFSTNIKPDDLQIIYGERAFSRLFEICNFMKFLGEDRRKVNSPVFKKNLNNPLPPPARETSIDEHKENKEMLERDYQVFIQDGTLSENAAILYNLLCSYGCHVATEEEMRSLMEMSAPTYQMPLKGTNYEKEQQKKAHIWKESRRQAVGLFYLRLKENGAKSIFGPKEVNTNEVVETILKSGKDA